MFSGFPQAKWISGLLAFAMLLASERSIAQTGPAKSTGTPIDTSFLVDINGVSQYLEIKGDSRQNPVLLFIHGGPAWPATPMLRAYNADLSKDFVLVSWDQRDCGKSLSDSSVSLTPDLYVEDAHEVTRFLKTEFNTTKIYIVCHSWGTIIGIPLVSRYPEDYYAYVGIGQVVNPAKALVVTRDYVVGKAKVKNDTSTIDAMKALPISMENPYALSFEGLMKFFSLANPYLISDSVAVLKDPTQLYADYSFTAVNWFAPLMRDGKELFNAMNASQLDLSRYTNFKLPIFFMEGRYDYTTPSTIAEHYFNSIKAPERKFFWFEQSAHSPNWEEPQLFHECLLEILAQTNHGPN